MFYDNQDKSASSYIRFLENKHKNLTKEQIKDIVVMLQSITRRAIEIYVKTRVGKENYGTI